MRIDPKTGLLDTARFIPSPNCDPRPGSGDISLLVIHNISLPPGQFGGNHIQQLFTNTLNPAEHPYFAEIYQMQVSAHLLILRDGSLIQFVPFDQRAWHAGKSCFDGSECCNDFSIGIELEGCDDIPYRDAQYRVLAQVSRCLMQRYPAITPQRITGHQHIAPERKTDPGSAFDWTRYHAALDHIQATHNA